MEPSVSILSYIWVQVSPALIHYHVDHSGLFLYASAHLIPTVEALAPIIWYHLLSPFQYVCNAIRIVNFCSFGNSLLNQSTTLLSSPPGQRGLWKSGFSRVSPCFGDCPGPTAKWLFFPLPSQNTRWFFCDLHCQNLVRFIKVKPTKAWVSPKTGPPEFLTLKVFRPSASRSS